MSIKAIAILLSFLWADIGMATYWCTAKSPYNPQEKFTRSGVDVPEAKNRSRTACADRYPQCQVGQ